jgi:hypothetical protein
MQRHCPEGRPDEVRQEALTMAGAGIVEFPPLLTAGRHPMLLPELRRLCVEGFPLSTRREPLMRSIEALCTAVSTAPAILKVGGCAVLFDFLGVEQFRRDCEGGEGLEDGQP